MSAYQGRPVVKPERLLLSTDRSKFSEGAIREAISLAKTYGSKLYVVSVAEVPDIISRYPLAAEKLIADTRRHLDSLKERAEKEGVLCETILAHGQEPYRNIVDEAAKNNVDMIIIGRRGRSSLERVLMGNVTAMVIGYSETDVLVVPEDATVSWECILLATDGSKYSEIATNRAIELAKSYNSELKVISVVDVTEEFLALAPGAVEDLVKKAKAIVEDVEKRASSEGIKTEGVVKEGEAYNIIVNFAKEQKANAIIMGSYGRTGLIRLLMGAVTERVIGYTSCPVLVVKA